MHKSFDLECRGDFEANKTAQIQDIGILPCQRLKCKPYQEHSQTIWLGHQEIKEVIDAGVFRTKRRRKDRANKAAEQIKRTDLSVDESKLTGANIGDQADHQQDPLSKSEIKPSHKVLDFSTDQQLQKCGQVPAVVEYPENSGEIPKNPKESAFPAKFPPYQESRDSEKVCPVAKPVHGKKRSISDYRKILQDRKSGLNPLKLEYESDTSSSIDFGSFGDDSPGGNFKEADLDLLPVHTEPTWGFSPRSPEYSPEYRYTPTETYQNFSDDSSGGEE